MPLSFWQVYTVCMSSTKKILRRLRTTRESRGLRQDQLAARLDVDRSTYARKETGAIPITTEEWLRIAKALDEEVAEFFHVDGTNADKGPSDGERALLKLYSSLTEEERGYLSASLRLVLKGINRKKVREALARLP